MKQDRVEITFRGGQTFSVDRAKLAKNMQRRQRWAEHIGLKPGQPAGELFSPNNKLSPDVLAAQETILDEHRKPA